MAAVGSASSEVGRATSLGERFRARFQRRTSSGRFIPEVDGLRFPAIALVVVGHLSAYFIDRPGAPPLRSFVDSIWRQLERHASEGVVLFFMISGFILALPFAKARLFGAPPVRLRDYYVRRVTRLEPPYLISLAAFLLFKIAARHLHLVPSQETDATLVRHFAVSAVYLHNVVYGVPSLINGVAWSLEVEIQFYLIVPLLTQVFRIRRTGLRRGVILSAIVAAITLQHTFILQEGRLYLSIAHSIQFFLFGFLLADLYLVDGLSKPAEQRSRQVAWDFIALAAWCAVIMSWSAAAPYPAITPFVSFIAFVATFRGRVVNQIFTNPWITTWGGMCYSIYLLHFMIIGMSAKILFRHVPPSTDVWRDVLTQGLVVLAIALGCSVLFFVLVERPCMERDWPTQLLARLRNESSRSAPTPAEGVDVGVL